MLPGYQLIVPQSPSKTEVYTFVPEHLFEPRTTRISVNKKSIFILDSGDYYGPISCCLLDRSDEKLRWEKKISIDRAGGHGVGGSAVFHRIQIEEQHDGIIVFGSALLNFYGFTLELDTGKTIWEFSFNRSNGSDISLFDANNQPHHNLLSDMFTMGGHETAEGKESENLPAKNHEVSRTKELE